ncbi:PREDICTED: MATH domain and coiled-coil domain-containing protein At3g58250-like [Nicotiana attenuata]|uniref:MATH domain and coiled-coil domain-containing protein At3g58250-like n=1 Tax=Nicotiana attenuata TaxID=49451 RepID=UPI00090512B8|nr:PREDICTED: MATH domain and coiled-coil domain-containing protein At3g58250-like [Nicotiana attenuata]
MAPVSAEEVNVGNRDASPVRYLLKFESFSVLSTNGINKYESSVFESCGYKWKLIIYPDGDVEDGHDHISVYLAIAETSSLQAGWEVNATFSFLIFDQIHDNYLIMRGSFCFILQAMLIKGTIAYQYTLYQLMLEVLIAKRG